MGMTYNILLLPAKGMGRWDDKSVAIHAFGSEILKPMVYVCLCNGFRRSEALSLKWNAVDFKNNTLSTVFQIHFSLRVATVEIQCYN